MSQDDAATVSVSIEQSVATLTLNRPGAGNAMNLRFGADILAAARALAADAGVRAIVLTGAGRNFCFGGDLRGMVEGAADIHGYLTELTEHLHAAISLFMRLDAPVIAAVNGTAAGAGLGLVLMSDLAIAARSAKFTAAYTAVGLTPDGANTFLLPRAVGHKRALELFLTNRVLGAEEALAWGIVNQVVADEEVVGEAQALARRLAAGPRGAYGLVKRLTLESLPGLDAQLAREGATIAERGTSAEAREGIAAFLGKRLARYV